MFDELPDSCVQGKKREEQLQRIERMRKQRRTDKLIDDLFILVIVVLFLWAILVLW